VRPAGEERPDWVVRAPEEVKVVWPRTMAAFMPFVMPEVRLKEEDAVLAGNGQPVIRGIVGESLRRTHAGLRGDSARGGEDRLAEDIGSIHAVADARREIVDEDAIIAGISNEEAFGRTVVEQILWCVHTGLRESSGRSGEGGLAENV
jgi:hypothetical protein